MKIKSLHENPYGELICQYFQTSFPKITEQTRQSLLEIISGLIIGTKENRYGPIPLPEQLVVIRKVIATAIERNEPIPVLIPWGGRKALTSANIDIAEVVALNQIIKLDLAIKNYYPRGLAVNIRIEDTGALWLYRSEKDSYPPVDKYSTDFSTLVNILKGDTIINAIKESNLMGTERYFELSSDFSLMLYDYLKASDFSARLGFGSTFEKLNNIGWKGEIPFEQRDHYRDAYKRINPELTDDQATKMLADYLGGAKARYDLNGRAEPKTDYSYIQLSFVAPIPGAPATIFNNTVYWRTLPLSDGRTHIPAWRAKGFFNINGNEIKSKITSFGNYEILPLLHPGKVHLSDGDLSVEVEVDYLLES